MADSDFCGNQLDVNNLQIWIDERPRAGSWNMAIDDVLLSLAVRRNVAALRMYRWETATLSLGYFQALAAKRSPLQLSAEWSKLPVVRRISGGGAILHDRELTYSITLPQSHPFARQPLKLYDQVHAAAIELLGEIGFAARLRGIADTAADSQFLCFLRGDPRDVVSAVGGSKVLGSAQRRRKGAVLQHGSLLLQASRFSPELPGVFDLAGKSDERSAADDGKTAEDEKTADDERSLMQRFADRLVRQFMTDEAAGEANGRSLPGERIVIGCPLSDDDWRHVAELAATDYANLNPA